MKENYYNKQYNINPRIREMIESKIGKKFDLSYVQIENIVGRVYKGEYKSLLSPFTNEDKRKVISYLKETSLNKFDDEVCETIHRFLVDNFNIDEIKSYLEYNIRYYYKPGKTYRGIKVNNDGVIRLICLSNLFNVKDGFIINKKDVNDIINYFDLKGDEDIKFKYDSNLTILDKDFTSDIIKKFNEIKLDYDIDYYLTSELFIVISNNEESTKYLKENFKTLKFEKILDFDYYNTETEQISDEIDLGGGMVMKGNFTKIGNVGGTEIIGVGSGTGNSVLDKLIKDDAMDMITRVMNGDMSRCGKGDEDVEDNLSPKDYYFSVEKTGSRWDMGEDVSSVVLVEKDFWEENYCLDDSMGSHSLNKNILTALDNVGVDSECELMEAYWEVLDKNKTEQEIIYDMVLQGFVYNPSINNK